MSYKLFEVIGAGEIKIGTDPNSMCGEEVGFYFSVGWSSHPFTGGVLPRKEALKLADLIYDSLNAAPTKQSVMRDFKKRMSEL